MTQATARLKATAAPREGDRYSGPEVKVPVEQLRAWHKLLSDGRGTTQIKDELNNILAFVKTPKKKK